MTRAELIALAQVYATLSLAERTYQVGRPGQQSTHAEEYRAKALSCAKHAEEEAY